MNTLLRVALNIPIDKTFDYLPAENQTVDQFHIGQRLSVPFGKQTRTAILLAIETSPTQPKKLKAIVEIIDKQPLLSAQDIKLLHWVQRYYHHPIGQVFMTAFPASLRKGKSSILKTIPHYTLSDAANDFDINLLKRAKKQRELFDLLKQHPQGIVIPSAFKSSLNALISKQLVIESPAPPPTKFHANNITRENCLTANTEQQHAIDTILGQLKKGFNPYLLDGVTGSGKTEVYLQLIYHVLLNQGQVLVLLPEITLTPQLQARFQQRFQVNIETYHSRHTDNQRQTAWLNMQSQHSQILLGTRSALFTPIPKLALIILDEEHDSSFKQQEGFRFSARDVAIVRAKMLNIPVILGSATPSLESLYNVQQQRYQHLKLPYRTGVAIPPDLALLDIRGTKLQEGLSPQLIKYIKQTLAKQEQVLIFLNRRGFAPTLICHDCGWIARCENCDSNLVIHQHLKKLRCHHCEHEQALPHQCPPCQSYELKPLGLGTERVEQTLQQLFSEHTIIRLDRDTTQRKGSLEQHLHAINSGQVDIILGTQMLAKGHHFPNVTLVVLLEIDQGLFSIDFHAAEKLAQLIIQVAGRAGRAEKKGRVLMQTRQPEHPLLNTLIHQSYAIFAQQALQERQAAQLPPYSYQAFFRAHCHDAQLAQDLLNQIVAFIQPLNTDILVLGPVPAPMAKRAAQFHYQLLLQHTQRPALHQLLHQLIPYIHSLKKSYKLRWSLDIDPIDLY